MRTITEAAALPSAAVHHAWANDEDLAADRTVKLGKPIEEREASAAELEEALISALFTFLWDPDDVAAAHATLRLLQARLMHVAAIGKVANAWARYVGGDIRPRPRRVVDQSAAIEAERTAKRVAAQAARERAYRERVEAELGRPASSQRIARVRPTEPLGAPSVVTEAPVSLEKVGLDAEV